ncbi:hypothetical protein BU26DRAFT_330227 [Trematosphaeria pertusa]|uniref:Uncharacterized protein n=1 Tax=Trematosphaeria pertusa TaxID=390896 RepID=A0A6A6IFG8_9PLEO|nr:uncharacterized protein BU26DRAFT_330227 [Trematosphaeria pertusa]KAF2248263.1 hypothetical protein BU26DRAFT_330227 [Trematosphaeria pertusa]
MKIYRLTDSWLRPVPGRTKSCAELLMRGSRCVAHPIRHMFGSRRRTKSLLDQSACPTRHRRRPSMLASAAPLLAFPSQQTSSATETIIQ